MKKLPRKLFQSLESAWVKRDQVPETADDPAYGVFFDFTSEMPMAYDVDDLLADAPKLTDKQRRAGAMILFATAIPFDGLLTGVFLNQPEIIPHLLEAAKAMGLKEATAISEQLVALLPPDLVDKGLDDRVEWAESDEATAEKIDTLGESDAFEDARVQMMHAAVRLAVDHPAEFFEAK